MANGETLKAIRVEMKIIYTDLDLLYIDILNTCLPVRVIVGYRPPSSDTASDVIQSINHVIEYLRSVCIVDASIVLMGDVNFFQTLIDQIYKLLLIMIAALLVSVCL